MTRRFSLFGLLLLVLSAAPVSSVKSAPTARPKPEGIVPAEGYVTAAKINLRSGPGTNYWTWGSLNKGDGFLAYAKRGGWLWVLFDDGTGGWLYGSNVRVRSVVRNLPDSITCGPPNGCDPDYPMVRLDWVEYDLDCSDLPSYMRRFPVSDYDPHGFDGDHDGWGCE